MPPATLNHLIVGLACLGVALLGLIVLRKAPAKSLESSEALLKGRPILHGLVIFLGLLGLVLVITALG